MHIHVTAVENTAIVALHGRFLGDKDVDDFCEKIRECLENGNTKVVIDLTHVDYINSMGLGALIAGYLIAKNSGGLLAYASGNPRVNELLHLTKTDQTVPVFASVEDARNMLMG